MSFFREMFRFSFLRRLKNPGSLLLLAVLLALTAAMLVPGARQETAVQVGLVLPEGEGEALERLLLQWGSGVIAFVPTDRATLERKILTGSWDCGLVVEEDFEKRLARLDTDGLVTLVTGPASTVYPLVRETAAACLTQLLGAYVSEDYMRSVGMDPRGLEETWRRLEDGTQRVDVRLQTLHGEVLALPELTSGLGKRIIRNLWAPVLLLWGLYLAVDMGKFLESPVALRLRPVRSVSALLLPQLCAGMGLPALWMLAVQPLLDGSAASAASMVFFALTVLALALLVARIRQLWQAVPVLAPFLAVACLVAEPVLVDVGALFPGLRVLTRLLPVSLYCRGDWPGALLLAAEGSALLTLSWGLDNVLPKMRRGD